MLSSVMLGSKRRYSDLIGTTNKELNQPVKKQCLQRVEDNNAWLYFLPTEILLLITKQLDNYRDVIHFMMYCREYLDMDLMTKQDWKAVLIIKHIIFNKSQHESKDTRENANHMKYYKPIEMDETSENDFCYLTTVLTSRILTSIEIGQIWLWAFRWDRAHFDFMLKTIWVEISALGPNGVCYDLFLACRRSKYKCYEPIIHTKRYISVKFVSILLQNDDLELLAHIKSKWGANFASIFDEVMSIHKNDCILEFCEKICRRSSFNVLDDTWSLFYPTNYDDFDFEKMELRCSVLVYYRQFGLLSEMVQYIENVTDRHTAIKLYHSIFSEVMNFITANEFEMLFSIFKLSSYDDKKGVTICERNHRNVHDSYDTSKIHCVKGILVKQFSSSVDGKKKITKLSSSFLNEIVFCESVKEMFLFSCMMDRGSQLFPWIITNICKNNYLVPSVQKNIFWDCIVQENMDFLQKLTQSSCFDLREDARIVLRKSIYDRMTHFKTHLLCFIQKYIKWLDETYNFVL